MVLRLSWPKEWTVGLSLIIGHVSGNKYLLSSAYSLIAFELRAGERRRVASTNEE